MKISFIGFGNMAKAMAQHLTKIPFYEIHAASPSLSIGKTNDGVQTHFDNRMVIKQSNLIILAVKPQQAVKVLKQIGPALPPNSLLISVVTGLSLACLAESCAESQAIVRSMPNLPMAIGQAATPLIANPYVTSIQRKYTQELFECAGIITWMKNDLDIDRMTALSGSGPAYLFYFLEAMMNAGKKLGLKEEIVKPFVLQTVMGAINMVNSSELDVCELRKKITSPGGTTAAAMDVLQEQEFDRIVNEAINAAFKQAKYLAEGNNP